MIFDGKSGWLALGVISVLTAGSLIAGVATAQMRDDPDNVARLGEWQRTSRVNTLTLDGTAYSREAAIASGHQDIVARFEGVERFACGEPLPVGRLEDAELPGLNVENCRLTRDVEGPHRQTTLIMCPFDGRSGANARIEQQFASDAVTTQNIMRAEFQVPGEPRAVVELDSTTISTRIGDCR